MSASYVLRYGDLLKIGFSSDLATRVNSIMSGIPGEVSFVGHMPGDEAVEAHLHGVFEESRFSGEWFRETDALRAFCSLVLIKTLPAPPERMMGARKQQQHEMRRAVSEKLRAFAEEAWPTSTHNERVARLVATLGWQQTRLRGFYYAEPKIVLRATESEQLDGLFAGRLPLAGISVPDMRTHRARTRGD